MVHKKLIGGTQRKSRFIQTDSPITKHAHPLFLFNNLSKVDVYPYIILYYLNDYVYIHLGSIIMLSWLPGAVFSFRVNGSTASAYCVVDWLVDGEGPIRGCCLTFARCLILSLVTSISANRWNNLRTNIPLSNVSSHKTLYACQNARVNPPRYSRTLHYVLWPQLESPEPESYDDIVGHPSYRRVCYGKSGLSSCLASGRPVIRSSPLLNPPRP